MKLRPSSKIGLLAGGAALLLSMQASAQTSAVADDLFRSGRRLLEEGKIAEACTRFAESQRLEPKPGTLLNLGLCHDREGKTATAYSELKEAAAQLARVQDPEREKLARVRIEALEPNIAKLAIDLAPGSPIDHLTIDAQEIGRAAWSVAIPLDPGPHQVTISAAGKRTITRSVEIGRTGGIVRLAMGPLEADVAAEPPRATDPRPPPREADRAKTRRTLSFVALGTGAVALGIGTVFGVRALSAKSDVDKGCPSARTCNDDGLDAVDRGKTDATISTIGVAVGVAAVGVGIYLLLTSSRDLKTARALVLPTLVF